MSETAVEIQEDPNASKVSEETAKSDSKPEDKETSKSAEDVKSQKIEGVPYDKQGKRPSDNTIDFDNLKEKLSTEEVDQIQKRFNSLYRQVKAQDRYLDQVGKDLDQKLSQITEQSSSTNQSVEKLTDVVKDMASDKETAKLQLEINDLQARKTQAYQDMDFDAVAKIDTQIMQKLSQPPKIEVPVPETKLTSEVAQEQQSEDLPSFTPREQAYINEWANEMAQDGMNFVRPWAQDWHPMNEFALDQTKALLKHPSFKNADLETILVTVDNIMNPNTPTQEIPQEVSQDTKKTGKTPPEVLSADDNLRTKRTEGKLTLTNDQMMVAERIYPKMAKEEAHKKYLGGLKKIQNA
jgi:hypothetical protein